MLESPEKLGGREEGKEGDAALSICTSSCFGNSEMNVPGLVPVSATLGWGVGRPAEPEVQTQGGEVINAVASGGEAWVLIMPALLGDCVCDSGEYWLVQSHFPNL